ncbi:hypothetical protein [Streptomyces sp. NPDC051218]|uniref:hypothetical protein n=1 Tax=Streptomyces sp. NPDC051218 TaxID=3365645 RepID=UPI0037A25313
MTLQMERLGAEVEHCRGIDDALVQASEVERTVHRALNRIEITGSRLVEETAHELTNALFNMRSALLSGEGLLLEPRLADYRMHVEERQEAFKAFQREAKETLGFLDF